jgi:HK97 family phage major capsid protein
MPQGSKDHFMNKELFLKFLRNQLSAAEIRSIGTGSITVPEELIKTLMFKASRFPVRSLATVHGVNAGKSSVAINSGLPAVAWVPEGSDFPTPDPAFAANNYTLNKIGGIAKVTEELLYDSAFNIDEVIAAIFGQAIGEKEDDAFINGTGAGQPRGILLDATQQAAGGTAPVYDDFLDIFAALPLRYHAGAAWMMNQKTLAAVIPLADASGNPLFIPGGRALSPEPSFIAGSILGAPVFLAALPDVATGAKPIAFGDFSRYVIVDRADGFKVRRLEELYSQNGEIGFHVYHRTDGALTDDEAVIALTMAA